MNNDVLSEIGLFKEIYFKEISRKESLDNNYPVNILTILTGLVVVNYIFIEKFITLQLEKCKLLFPLMIFISGLIVFIICIYWLAMGFNKILDGYNYSELPLLKEINSKKPTFKEEDYLNELRTEIIESTSVFQAFNQERLDYYHKSRKFIVLAFITTSIFVSVYYLIGLL